MQFEFTRMSEFKYVSADGEVELNVTHDEFETRNHARYRKSAKTPRGPAQ